MFDVKVTNKYKDPTTDNTVIIHRGSKNLGNPFKMEDLVGDRDIAVNLFNDYFLEKLPFLNRHLIPLIEWQSDLELQCFCAPCRCHGDTYKEFILFARELKLKDPTLSAVVEFRRLKGYEGVVNKDGVDHINVYSKAKTGLGRSLSNFTYSPFYHDKYGQFDSMEGFWGYVATGHKHESLKTIHGYRAKEEMKKYERVFNSNFDEEIRSGIFAKLDQNKDIRNALLASVLPFSHYYVYNNTNDTDGLKEVIVRNPIDINVRSIQEYRTKYTYAKPTIIAGSRTVKDYKLVKKAIRESGFLISSVISGMAKGPDILGRHYALEHGIPVQEFPVTKEEWKASKAAGIIRNGKMEQVAEQGIVIVENNSSGSMDMIKRLKKAGKAVHEVHLTSP